MDATIERYNCGGYVGKLGAVEPCPTPARWVNLDTGTPICDDHKRVIESINPEPNFKLIEQI